MKNPTHFERLVFEGDPLEREIACSWEELSLVLEPYADIWHDFILPRRLPDPPGRVAEEWMPFAGSHYTALIRVYHAYKSYLGLRERVAAIEGGQDSAVLLLEVHELTASFWEHIGSAIDNLAMCYLDAPGRLCTITPTCTKTNRFAQKVD
jgi:hypothetical protein